MQAAAGRGSAAPWASMKDVARLFLGIDGGQTSTTAWIGDETGRVLGTGRAGPCNHARAARSPIPCPFRRRSRPWCWSARRAVGSACAAAGLAPEAASFEAACLGLSGGPEEKEALLRELVQARRWRLTHDADVALSGATGGGPGVIVIAGTGSIAFGRNAEGKTARAGGWGYIFGDEGGAFDLVRQALRAALRHEEGWGPPTALRQALLDATGASNANDLLHRFYGDEYPRQRIAALAPLVGECALNGDAVALELLHQAGQQLATLAAAVRRQLFAPEEAVVVSFAGGVFENPYTRERFRAVVELEAANRVEPPRFPPVAGALIEAWRLAGLDRTPRTVPGVAGPN